MALQRLLLLIISILLLVVNIMVSHAKTPIENSLTQRINAMLNSDRDLVPGDTLVQNATILTPPEQLTTLCEKPEITLPAGNRLSGQRSVALQCGEKRRFIQINITAEGRYWVTSRPLKKGHVLTLADLHSRHGSLAHLPGGVIFSVKPITGAVITRNMQSGQAITEDVLRQHWKVVNGATVDVIAGGDGFMIRTQGKALDNAAKHGTLRVRLATGKVVSGKVNDNGDVLINPVN